MVAHSGANINFEVIIDVMGVLAPVERFDRVDV
jgi:hypothetical protein